MEIVITILGFLMLVVAIVMSSYEKARNVLFDSFSRSGGILFLVFLYLGGLVFTFYGTYMLLK